MLISWIIPLAMSAAVVQPSVCAGPIIPRLLADLQDSDRNVRLQAVEQLDKIKPMSAEVLRGLREALADEDEKIADWAAGALARGGRDAVPCLLEALNDKKSRTRCRAASAFQNMGLQGMQQHASSAVPTLLVHLHDREPDVRTWIALALSAIGDPRAVEPLLTVATGDDHDAVRISAMGALGSMGMKAKKAVPRLREIFVRDASLGKDQIATQAAGMLLDPNQAILVDA